MAGTRLEIAAGAAVLAVAAAFTVFAAKGAGIGSTGSSYALTASFRAVDGISAGSDVRMAGIKVGSISALTLNPQTFMADAVVQIRNDVQLPTDSAILISSEGLLGGNFVEIIPGGAEENLAPGEEIEDTQGSVSLVSLLMKFVGSGGNSDQAATP